jgi:hypothetical protein
MGGTLSNWYAKNPFTQTVQQDSGYSAELTAEYKEQEVMGFLLIGQVKHNFFNVTCPCGITDSYALNGFPETDTLQSCGKPNHWFVKYQE